jgi:hypothetical protein
MNSPVRPEVTSDPYQGIYLVANPVKCKMFDQHSFRKEKCKSCGLSWVEHKDCIPQSLVAEFIAVRQRKIDCKGRLDAVVQAEKEKKRSKSRITEEDSWLFDKAKRGEAPESDSEGEGGFKMITQDEIVLAPRPAVDQKFKVTNLIDFSECDLPHAETRGTGIPSRAHVASTVSHDFISQTQLLHEIHHLRQMLEDANAEKSIQVSMAREEVANTIAELQRQCKEKDTRLESAHQEIMDLKAQVSKPVQIRTPGFATELPELGECTKCTAREGNSWAKIGQDADFCRFSSTSTLDSALETQELSANNGQSVSPAEGAQAMGRHAALALKEAIRDMHEVRINAEKQFAWISKRIRTTKGRMNDAKFLKSMET